VPHFGGAIANVALLAARAGARVALAGGVGEDHWGGWLREQLVEADVDLTRFETIPGHTTPLALTTVDSDGEPTYTIYGDQAAGTVVHALRDGVDGAIGECAALFISTNTLVGDEERELTMRARDRALELERPVVFDPNLRLHRWSSRTEAAASANACVKGALLVRLTAAEATVLTREDDPERAASSLLKAGARNVVITLGPDGAILRGGVRLDAPGVPTRVVSAIGAGDALTAALIARLAAAGWYEPAIAAGLRDGLAEAALACQRWGAVD